MLSLFNFGRDGVAAYPVSLGSRTTILGPVRRPEGKGCATPATSLPLPPPSIHPARGLCVIRFIPFIPQKEYRASSCSSPGPKLTNRIPRTQPVRGQFSFVWKIIMAFNLDEDEKGVSRRSVQRCSELVAKVGKLSFLGKVGDLCN